MTDLKRVKQGTDGSQIETDNPTRQGKEGVNNQGAEFGTHDAATRGKDDADPSGESANQAHGHPREEHGANRS